MHRTDSPGSTPQNGFTDGDVQTGTEATTVGAKFMNTLQEEVAAVVEAAGIVLDENDNGQLLQALGGAGGGLKNLLVNGGFNVNQRVKAGNNAQAADSPIYTLDRWVGHGDDSGGAGTMHVSTRTSNADQALIGSAENGDLARAPNFIFLTVNTQPTVGSTYLEQRVEFGLRETVGQEMTFSLYMDSLGYNLLGNLDIWQHFGDGAGASAPVLFATKTVYPGSDSSFRRHSVTGTAPVIAGKTIDGNPSIRVRWSPANAAAGFYEMKLALAQLELGASPSGFDHRPLSIERVLAGRYFETSQRDDGVATEAGAAAGYCPAGSTAHGVSGRFAVEKRTDPTMTWLDKNENTGFISWPTPLAVTGTAFPNPKTTGWPVVTPNGPNGMAFGHWRADAEI